MKMDVRRSKRVEVLLVALAVVAAFFVPFDVLSFSRISAFDLMMGALS
jgi:hypothetical protein